MMISQTNNDDEEEQYQLKELKMFKADSYTYNYEDELRSIQAEGNKFEDYFNDYLRAGFNEDICKEGKKFQINNFFDSEYECFEQIIENQEVEQKNNLEIKDIKIVEQIKKPKFQNKSYCRYILLYVFRTIESEQYAVEIAEICQKYKVNLNEFKNYYRKQRILIMGYQNLKKELIMNDDTNEVKNRKMAFKDILIWYMNNLATKHILNSKKQDLQEYLKFKNYVMAYYIHVPKIWSGNKAVWRQQV